MKTPGVFLTTQKDAGGLFKVAIALGSNLGDRQAHLDWAVQQLGDLLQHLRASPFVDTAPHDVPGPQPRYLNGVVVGETRLGPADLLDRLLALERARGRRRSSVRAPRTLDLDLILYGDLVRETPRLTVPHPRFRERPFVLEPLAVLAPDWIDPETGRRMSELASEADERMK
ncbi:MAG TPA: 2-amino-4-hydroxy-6-hydroxymethyldihydropteridine diphosphokinase [Vicinamibacterales bacterium]|nr:2-amino-4-hydroxy-6-hydroxymethyldihydropteridine diphosphokinase [Vicinamibacterales bacterium]